MAQNYKPLYRLAAGGMAEVWVAQSVSVAGFKKKVAIKRILPGLLKDDRFVRMFLDEARLSLHFNHANVVTVFDLGKSDETYFIVMEYVEGTTLKQVLEHLQERGKKVPLPLVIWILNETLKGLQYAHDLNDPDTGEPLHVVHRDISPPNLLISWNGEVKLTDFGLAKATSQLESTDAGVVKGKFSYLSPEAAHGQPVDGRTDVFAVGILAYEMLTMRRLFLGDTDYQTVEAVRAAEIPSIRAQNPDVSPELERIILKSLTRDVNDRYRNAADFADALLGYLFENRLKVSARDLSTLMGDLRERKEAEDKVKAKTDLNLIEQLMAEELANFRSIDEDSGEGEAGEATGSRALLEDDFDSSAPLVDGLDELMGPDASTPLGSSSVSSSPLPAAGVGPMLGSGAGRSPLPIRTGGSGSGSGAGAAPARPEPEDPPAIEEPQIAATRLPSPAPRETSSNAGIWVMIVLLLAGGGAAAAWYLKLIPGL
ncbi:serine/threonine protein kinase [Enhygromyxa salina]|uniref:non-specific serine/threonine protein kinase n=1 Tax=Enhygromyxa salina TaxID=215803 RepID=A0A2S9Y7V7_9BACT|nr:serine/threonine-protein kinase [Enhygromyxa salina]PRQ01142.1 Tyrosine-protein kinase MasK [Enhygromyxa salina]